ncbi:MAG: VOC family protein [Rhodococcus sp. (in: high G+C Gram-positive bacteria)]|uniref:VOC family protein n=1 Tax=Rhodococcus sp. TaxID=1831 RepID=UPI003BB4C1C8
MFPCLTYDDARGAIRFLVDGFGFVESAVYGDGDRVDHAELVWPHGGGIMLGSGGRDTPIDLPAGTGSVYLVLPDSAAVDAVFERAVAHGAVVTRGLRDEDYGSHGFTCRDPQGVHWSFGTYRGHAASGE